MKFLHTADWHIGRKLNGFSLLEEQAAVFKQLMVIAKEEKVDAIVIAGDLYDRTVPSVEAVSLFNEMMITMNIDASLPVLAISGNHDSATRLETATPWLKAQQFHLHTRLEQAFDPIILGDVAFFLLPYVEPFHIRQYFEDDSIRDIETGMTRVIEKMTERFTPNRKHVLVSHFFAAGSSRSESETPIEVGGLDSVPLDLLTAFDYVALGHLHDKNAIKKETSIQYSGALLKYSLSEEKQEKGVRLIELTDDTFKNDFIPIEPLRDVKKITASFKELCTPTFYRTIDREAYIAIALTDTDIIENALNELRQIYPYMISLERVATKNKQALATQEEQKLTQLTPEKLIETYFKDVTDQSLSVTQKEWLEQAILEGRKEK